MLIKKDTRNDIFSPKHVRGMRSPITISVYLQKTFFFKISPDLDDARPGLLVEPLHVPPLAFLQGRVNENLKEG